MDHKHHEHMKNGHEHHKVISSGSILVQTV